MISGIGVDICKIPRIAGILRKTYAGRFLEKVLHTSENKLENTAEYVAGRWAAKEALVKATGRRDVIFSQVEITYNALGQPNFAFYSETKQRLSSYNFFLSISHELDITVAMVVMLTNEKNQ